MPEPSAARERRDRSEAILSMGAAGALIAGLCMFAVLIVVAPTTLATPVTDGLSVYLVLMIAIAVGVWLLTFAFMRRLGRLEGRR